MSNRLRHFVLWLLMAWLPVQGMAAVMPPCAMAHRGMSSASVNGSEPCDESAMAADTTGIALAVCGVAMYKIKALLISIHAATRWLHLWRARASLQMRSH